MWVSLSNKKQGSRAKDASKCRVEAASFSTRFKDQALIGGQLELFSTVVSRGAGSARSLSNRCKGRDSLRG